MYPDAPMLMCRSLAASTLSRSAFRVRMQSSARRSGVSSVAVSRAPAAEFAPVPRDHPGDDFSKRVSSRAIANRTPKERWFSESLTIPFRQGSWTFTCPLGHVAASSKRQERSRPPWVSGESILPGPEMTRDGDLLCKIAPSACARSQSIHDRLYPRWILSGFFSAAPRAKRFSRHGESPAAIRMRPSPFPLGQ